MIDGTSLAAIITAIISLIGSIIIGYWNQKSQKAKAHTEDVQATAQLLEKAMDMNQQEFETLRVLNADLREQLKYLTEQLSSKEEIIKKQGEQIQLLQIKLTECVSNKYSDVDKGE